MIRVYTDGASRGNPGPASIGVVIERNGEKVELWERIGEATNNVAEYQAVLKALGYLIRHGWVDEPVELCTDSELLYRQLTGRYRVRSPSLRPLYERVRQLARKLPGLRFRWVPREENRGADALTRKALTEQRRAS